MKQCEMHLMRAVSTFKELEAVLFFFYRNIKATSKNVIPAKAGIHKLLK